jgi:hypothetical protein
MFWSKYFAFIFIFFYGNSFAQTVTVEWNSTQGNIPANLVSLNIWDGTNPNVASDASYQTRIEELGLSMVRYHSAEMVTNGNPKSWVDFAVQKWDGQKVKVALSALHNRVGERIISIFNFPPWICPDPNNIKYIPPAQADAFGDWCAALVDTVNNNSPYYTTYWEVFNELEDQYVGKMNELIIIYNTAVTKMKAKDPNIKVGALSLTQPWWSFPEQEQFYAGVAANLDFVSCHSYGMGSSNVPNTTIYNAAKNVSLYTGNNMRSRMNNAGIASSVPIFLGETNISYAWNLDPQSKMASNVGAVYDAIALKTAIDDKKLASVQFFNDRDGFYGCLSASNAKRPAFELLKLAAKNLSGNFVRSTSTVEDSIQATAVVNANGYKTIMLINRSINDKTITIHFTGSFNANGISYTESSIKNNLTTQTLTWSGTSRTFTMPSESVIFWVFGSNVTLPLDLLSFEGKQISTGNQIEWRIAQSTNVRTFELERSEDANRFQKIFSIVSATQIAYAHEDQTADKNKPAFYRLKIIDKDDHFEYSKVIRVDQTAKSEVEIYPTITDNFININAPGLIVQRIQIINSNGQVVQQIEHFVNKVNVEALANGTYFLVFTLQNQQKLTKKFVKTD